LQEFRTALLQEIETREKSHTTSLSDLPLLSGAQRKSNSRTLRCPNQISKDKPNNRLCPYCGEQHRLDRCQTLASVSERISLLRQERRCFNCLGANHTTSQCFSKGRCLKCKRKHHTSICESINDHPEFTSNRESLNIEQESQSKTQAPETQPKAHMGTTHTYYPEGTILMQSARVTVIGSQGTIPCKYEQCLTQAHNGPFLPEN